MNTKVGEPLHKVDLAGGATQLIAIPDEQNLELPEEKWRRLSPTVRFVKIDVPVPEYRYHYRLFASIAMAEAARQIGRLDARRQARPVKRTRFYKSMTFLSPMEGEEVTLADLEDYM